MNKTFIFDLDDTLIFTQHYYTLAQAELIKFILENLGPKSPNAKTIFETQDKKDLESVKTAGFLMERFPESFANTYRDIAQKMGISEEKIERGAKNAYEIGERVFDTRYWMPDLVPGAKQVLNFLSSQGDELFLLTTGDPRVQNRKIEFYDLEKWFGDKTFVVPHHKKEKLIDIIGKRDKNNIWFTGNSARSDIAPSLEIGIGAIYIPQETWAYDEHNLDNIDKTRLIILKEISEIPQIYHGLNKNTLT